MLLTKRSYMRWSKIEQIISYRDAISLAGFEAQRQLAPSQQRAKHPSGKNYRKAGVAVILFPKDTQTHLILIKRAIHPKDKHSGQIGFPGGKYENSDASMLRAAIRETTEEIGIELTAESILTPLSTLYVPVSNFMIYPYLMFLQDRPEKYELQLDEVSSVIEVPLSHLYESDISIGDVNDYDNIPHFKYANEIIWGATAMILNEVLRTLSKSIVQFKIK